MSIIAQNDSGWLICSQKLANKAYEMCLYKESVQCKLIFRKDFYEINTPLLMNSAVHNKVKPLSLQKKKRAKKKLKSMNDEHQSHVLAIIDKATEMLVKLGFNQCFFQNAIISPEEWLRNNDVAREAYKAFDSLSHGGVDPDIVYFYENLNDFSEVKDVFKQEYVFPPRSSFLLSDIKDIGLLCGTLYDLIVMDPPWENKSVRRNRRYSTLNCELLQLLPIKELSSPDCLVVVWSTNNSRQMTYVKETLFPAWELQHCADWHWSKVTQKGQFIQPLDSNHKKPYENLILGRRKLTDKDADTSKRMIIEPHKVLVSVPSSIHSHKPPLSDILKPYLPENPKCLELFARYLLPGWTSWGNEVLKLQNLHLFEKIVNEDERICLAKTEECRD